jgi:hypothetical protein
MPICVGFVSIGLPLNPWMNKYRWLFFNPISDQLFFYDPGPPTLRRRNFHIGLTPLMDSHMKRKRRDSRPSPSARVIKAAAIGKMLAKMITNPFGSSA